MKKNLGIMFIGIILGFALGYLFESDIWYDSNNIMKEIKKVNPLAIELVKHERKWRNSRLIVRSNNGSLQELCLDANLRRIINISECKK